eukprot:TRINITY_DN7072_c0_g1_i4.p1 TRINITY_DN7072_c0_g1~~TRINITY_DN7072_c0_g1_i4.p1  ORF type:complete len:345 (-),score=37.17 TRINITY_DN7072_c0_g1_i4:143-1177(-)
MECFPEGVSNQEAPFNTWDGRLEFCKKLPKCELHAHLNGSIRDSTIRELAAAQQRNGSLPVLADNAHRLLAKKGARTLSDCFQLFDIIHRLTTEHATITRITEEVIQDFADDNVRYLELRTTPKTRPDVGMTKTSYIEAVLRGFPQDSAEKPNESVKTGGKESRGEQEGAAGNGSSSASPCLRLPPITVRLLLSIDRRESAEDAMETVRLAVEYRDRGVVGVDLSGNPACGKWATFAPALLLARQHGLALTLHCGEIPNAEEVGAMLALKPERVGHVCCLAEPEWSTLLRSNIPVELCLTSNVKTESVESYSKHHFGEKDLISPSFSRVPDIPCALPHILTHLP